MAKTEKSKATTPSFEIAIGELEGIVRQLEDGELGLSESLVSYEKGIGHLRVCHEILRQAEHKISMLTRIESDGTAVTTDFDESSMSLAEKQEARGKRRSRAPAPDDAAETDMDTPRGLF